MFERELESVARRVEADLVHVHHPHYVADVALRVAARLGVPGVYELRCFNGDYDLGTRSPYRTLRGRWQNELEFALARDASAVVTISDGQASILRRRGVAAERLFVVRNSVDTTRFTVDPARTSWAARMGERRAGEPLALHVGYATTFERMENLDVAVDAARIAHAELAEHGIELTLTLAGTGRDWARIAARVEALDVGAYVKLPGHVPYADMPAFYRDLDLFLVPRGAHVVSMDTTPLKPLEALACGLPLLVTDLPAMRELLESRDDVRFTKPAADAMARGLVTFAREPWRGSGEISERAWAAEIGRYAEIYATALRNGPPRASGRRGILARLRAGSAHARAGAVRTVRQGACLLGVGHARPRRRHVVVCGFPRTGSTLLQLMIACCVPGVRTFDGEVEALGVRDAVAPTGRLLSKCPNDVFAIERIAAHYAAAVDGVASFVLTVRDPRDIMTSRHAAYTRDRGYYVTPERFAAVWKALRAARARDDAVVLRYEDLVRAPDSVERLFAARFGWRAEMPFARFHERAVARGRDSMTDGALGGLRPLDATRVERWRDAEHRRRLAELVATTPALAEACIELGYETDDAWAHELLVGTPEPTPLGKIGHA